LDDTVPSPFEELNFVQQLKQTLTPGGILLYNRLAVGTKNLEKNKHFFKKTFLSVFPDGAIVKAQGNWILLNEKSVLKS